MPMQSLLLDGAMLVYLRAWPLREGLVIVAITSAPGLGFNLNPLPLNREID